MHTDRWRILIAEPDEFPQSAIAALRQVASVDLGISPSECIVDQFDRYDAVLTRLGHRVERRREIGPVRCRVLGVPTTGLDHIDEHWCEELGIEVVSLRGETTFLRSVRATAEMTLTLMLAVLRQLVPAVESVSAGQWERDRFRGREISGSTVGILGVGRIGAMVADVLHVMGANVIGFDTKPGWYHPNVSPTNSVEELCQRAEILTVHIPYRVGDAALLGRNEIAHLRQGAVIINTSRGGTIDESALCDALVANRLGGVGLDVLSGEPHVAGNTLRRLALKRDDVIITPHVGGNTIESRERTESFIAAKVISALEGSSA